MQPLTTIIKNDLEAVGTAVKSGLYGAMHGLYTPFALRTGNNHWNSRFNKNYEQQLKSKNSLDRVRMYGETAGQSIAAAGVFGGGFYFALPQDRVGEYFAALAAANIIDYAVGVVKKSRK